MSARAGEMRMTRAGATLKSRRFRLVWLCALATACDGDPSRPGNPCGTESLPLEGAPGAPRVTDVALEVQPDGIVVLVTAVDPQGNADLLDVVQSIGVFPDPGCDGATIVLEDDLAGSGVEESFGTAVSAAAAPALYDDIAAADRWPVELDFRDTAGNRTTGRVQARIIR